MQLSSSFSSIISAQLLTTLWGHSDSQAAIKLSHPPLDASTRRILSDTGHALLLTFYIIISYDMPSGVFIYGLRRLGLSTHPPLPSFKAPRWSSSDPSHPSIHSY